MLAKIKEIVQSYATMVNPTKEQEMLARLRLRTCMQCEEWQENSIGVETCKLCGCYLKAKVFSPAGMQACPKLKWVI